jgi:hypothetical protein
MTEVEMPASRIGPGARSILRASGCGACGFLSAPSPRGHVHQHAAVFDLHRIGRHRILLEAGLALAVAAMEFPVVARAGDVFAVEPAFAERAADVIARVGDDAETGCSETKPQARDCLR